MKLIELISIRMKTEINGHKKISKKQNYRKFGFY